MGALAEKHAYRAVLRIRRGLLFPMRLGAQRGRSVEQLLGCEVGTRIWHALDCNAGDPLTSKRPISSLDGEHRRKPRHRAGAVVQCCATRRSGRILAEPIQGDYRLELLGHTLERRLDKPQGLPNQRGRILADAGVFAFVLGSRDLPLG